MSRYRKLDGPLKWYFMAATWAGIIVTIYYIFRIVIADIMILDLSFYGLLLGLYLPLAFLLFPATKNAPSDRVPWYDLLLAVASALGPMFVFVFGLTILTSSWPIVPPPLPYTLGLLTWLTILEAVRRAFGVPMLIVAGGFSIYPMFASQMPAILFAKSYPLQRLVGYHFLSSESIFGLAWQTFGNMLVGFLIFGIALQVTGGAKFLLDFSIGLVGRMKGAPALMAIVSSALMASVSGSVVANVIGTGSITIPAMKKMGYKPHVAGAIEATASTGGTLMPPVMGATAFIMASFMEVPYAHVALAATIPMLVYYAGVFAQVYFHGAKSDFQAYAPTEIPTVMSTLKTGWFYLGSLVVLVYGLFWLRIEAWAPYLGAVFLFLCAFVRKETRPNWRTLSEFTVSVGHVLTELAPSLAAVGLLMGALSLTGVGQSLSGELVILAGNNLYLLLLLGAIGGLILGTGMTMTPAYIFMAMIFVPSLLQLGVDRMAANLFFLYWGMISFITPPVAIGVYAACSLAGSKLWPTGLQAVRFGIVGFIIPFFFVLEPALVANGSPLVVLQALFTAIIGAVFLGSGFEGRMFWIGKLGTAERVLAFPTGLLFMYGSTIADLLGVAMSLLIIGSHLGLGLVVAKRISFGVPSNAKK